MTDKLESTGLFWGTGESPSLSAICRRLYATARNILKISDGIPVVGIGP